LAVRRPNRENAPVSPVQRSRGHASRALIVATVGIAVAAGGLWLASLAVSHKSTLDVNLGTPTFQGGRADRLAKAISKDGPIIYSDVSGDRKRDIIVQHLGTDPAKRWYAFLAQPKGKPRTCFWQWKSKEQQFRAICDRSLTLPADGAGTTPFPVKVIDGRLDVDLNFATRPSTTTTSRPGTSTTSGG
jgi:hypothetical protein